MSDIFVQQNTKKKRQLAKYFITPIIYRIPGKRTKLKLLPLLFTQEICKVEYVLNIYWVKYLPAISKSALKDFSGWSKHTKKKKEQICRETFLSSAILMGVLSQFVTWRTINQLTNGIIMRSMEGVTDWLLFPYSPDTITVIGLLKSIRQEGCHFHSWPMVQLQYFFVSFNQADHLNSAVWRVSTNPDLRFSIFFLFPWRR